MLFKVAIAEKMEKVAASFVLDAGMSFSIAV